MLLRTHSRGCTSAYKLQLAPSALDCLLESIRLSTTPLGHASAGLHSLHPRPPLGPSQRQDFQAVSYANHLQRLPQHTGCQTLLWRAQVRARACGKTHTCVGVWRGPGAPLRAGCQLLHSQLPQPGVVRPGPVQLVRQGSELRTHWAGRPFAAKETTLARAPIGQHAASLG